MAASPSPAASKTQLVDCAKCDGRGRIDAFTHVHGGACFPCEGTGKVEIARISETEAFQMMVGNIYGTVGGAMRFADDGNLDRADFYLTQVLADMFKCGTAHAREILDFIGEGRYWDAHANDFRQLTPTIASGLRTRLIELGREAKAA